MRPKKLPEIRPVFRLEQMASTKDGGNRHVERHFRVMVEANVIGTDDVVLDRRATWHLCFLKVTRRSATFTFTDEHSVDGSREWMRPVRVYKEFHSPAARRALHRLNERLTELIAPHQRSEVFSRSLGMELCKEVHDQITVMDVLQS